MFMPSRSPRFSILGAPAPARTASRLLGAALVLGATMGSSGCRTAAPAQDTSAAVQSTGDAPPAPGSTAGAALRADLRAAPAPADGEGFDAWLTRLQRTAPDTVWAKAALRAQAAKSSPADMGRPAPGSAVSQARADRAIALGVWARRRFTARREASLAAVVKHATTNDRESTTPGQSPAFDGLKTTLAAEAAVRGLTMHTTAGIAHHMTAGTPERDPLCASPAVLVHADVVPADAKAWDTPPFTLTAVGDKLVGRGALDDKGPLVAAMDALEALSTVSDEVRQPTLVIGTSEETHWDGVRAFLAAHAVPEVTIVADAAFPVGVGEKGITTVRLESAPRPATHRTKARGPSLVGLHAGMASNQVPMQAAAMLSGVTMQACMAAVAPLVEKAEDLRVACQPAGVVKKDLKGQVKPEDREAMLVATGTAAHGAAPQNGHNAAQDLLYVLRHADLGLERTPCLALAQAASDVLGRSVWTPWLDEAATHPAFTRATVNLGTLRTNEHGACTLALNTRWPPGLTPDAVKTRTEAAVRHALSEADQAALAGTTGGGLAPFYAGEDHHVVRSLMQSYALVTGKPGRAITISGTTYAKAVPGAVTFGPVPEGSHGGRMHVPGEYITRDELAGMVEMLTTALYLYRPAAPPACTAR